MEKPSQVKLKTIVNVARYLSKVHPSFAFYGSNTFEFEYEKNKFCITKICAKSKLDNIPYDNKTFQLQRHTLVDEFTIWFLMGDNEVPVVI